MSSRCSFLPTLLFILASNLVVLSTSFGSAPMAGTYVIGTSPSAQFNSFGQAVDSLVSRGISAAVTFEVESGTYSEMFTIPSITGTSPTSPITFISQSQNANDVTLSFPATTNALSTAMITLANTSYIAFRDMTLSRTGTAQNGDCVGSSGGAVSIRFNGVRFVNSVSLIGGNSDFISGSPVVGGNFGEWRVQNCYFENGTGIRVLGTGTGTGSILIENNQFVNVVQGLISNPGPLDIEFKDNEVDLADAAPSHGVHISFASGEVLIEGNRISGDQSDMYGIRVFSSSGTALQPHVIRNNRIHLTGPEARGIDIEPSSTYVNVLHNTVVLDDSGSSSDHRGIQVFGNMGSSNINIMNNAISTQQYALFVLDAAGVGTVDHNVYHSTSPSLNVSWEFTNYTDRSSLNTASGQNANCIFIDPGFVDPAADFNLLSTSPCIGAGIVLAGVSDDIDDNVRPNPVGSDPDIGAYESVLALPHMAGTYIIGPSMLADYVDFTAAIDALEERGTDGDVTFEVESGIYDERLHLPAITMLEADARITFTGQAQDSSQVILRAAAFSTVNNDNHMVHMDGMDNVTWEHMTFERYGSNGFGNIFVFSGTGSSMDPSKNAIIRNCFLVRSDAQLNIGIYGWTGTSEDSLTIVNNRFFGMGTGLSWSNSSSDTDAIRFEGNILSGVSGGVSVTQVSDGLSIKGNNMELNGSAGSGVTVNNCSGDVQVCNNRVRSTGTGQMIDLVGVTGTPAQRVLIANNELIGRTAGAQGIKLSFACAYVDIQHNSVSMGDGFGVFFQSATLASNIRFGNNAISSDDIAFECAFPSAVSLFSNSVLYTTGPELIRWGNDYYATLYLAEKATNAFTNCIEADPLFDDPDLDLNILNRSPCAENGANIPGVTTDINGNTRGNPTGSLPDIGAFEIGAIKKLSLKVLLQGPYDASTGLMRTDLMTNNLLPRKEPFSDMGILLSSDRDVLIDTSLYERTGIHAIVDWLIVELYDDACGCNFMQRRPVLVQANGLLVDHMGKLPVFPGMADDHHIRIRHRNHLPISTFGPRLISSANQVTYNLSIDAAAVYGTDAQANVNGTYLMWAGDVNTDGEIKYLGSNNDRDPVLVRIGGSIPTNTATGYFDEDVNLDGEVSYVGSNNDRDPILVNIGGSNPTNTRVAQLP